MKLITSFSLVSLAATAVMAFESTVPCLMWSPKNFIDNVQKVNNQFVISQTDATDVIYSALASNVCSAKVIAIVNQPEIHSNDFFNHKDAFNQLMEHSNSANSRAQFEYITQGVDIDQLSKMIASRCDASIAILDPSQVSADDFNSPVVAVVPLEKANNDVQVLSKNDALLGQFINTVQEKVENDYLVIYTSSEPKEKRVLERRAVPAESKSAPIFETYQLFTPGVFMVLGVVLLLLFIAGTGITWLVGIQTPARFEAKQKKN